MAGVGLESTAATVRLAALAADCGADLALVITPFYFRSGMNEEALRPKAFRRGSPKIVLAWTAGGNAL